MDQVQDNINKAKNELSSRPIVTIDYVLEVFSKVKRENISVQFPLAFLSFQPSNIQEQRYQ